MQGKPSIVNWKFIELLTALLICRVPCGHDETAMRGRPKAELVLSEAERDRPRQER